MSDEVKVRLPDQCPECGEKVVPFYDPNDKRITHLPAYCDGCKTLWMDGEKIDLPKESERHFSAISKQAREAAEKATEEIHQDPKVRVRKYFENVFKWAFAEGFVRAYAYFRHKAKEGRMRRIREIWNKGEIDEYKVVFMLREIEDIRELDRLIKWKP